MLEEVEIGEGFTICELLHRCNNGKMPFDSRWVNVQPLTRLGYIISHGHDDMWMHRSIINTCLFHDTKHWTISQEEPLTIAEPFSMRCCGAVGRITEGRWEYDG